MRAFALSLFVLASAALGACSKPSADSSTTTVSAAAVPNAPAGFKGSCDMRAKLSSCDDFKPASDDGINKAGCDVMSGTFGATPCTKDKAVASCEDDDSTTFYYADGPTPFDAEGAKVGCDLVKGKFTSLAVTPSPQSAVAKGAPKPAPSPKKH